MDNKLRNILNEGLAQKGISLSKLSETLDIDRTLISKYINGQRLPSMEVILKINSFLLSKPSDRVTAMKLIIPSLKNIQSMKVALELAMLYRDYDLLAKVIDMIQNASKSTDRDWGDFYEFFLKRQKKEMEDREYYDQLIKFKTNSKELNIFREVMIIFYHFNISADWPQALDLIQKTMPKAESLPESLLKRSFLSRLYNSYANVGLRLGVLTPKESRKWLELSSEYSVSEYTKFSVIYNIGGTYQFSDKLKACQCIEKAVNLWEENDVSYFKNAVPYLRSLTIKILKMETGIINVHEVEIDESFSEEAKMFYYMERNEYDKANEIYQGLSLEKQQSEHILYFKGVIEQSIPILFQSLMKFIGRYDFFEAQYPGDELIKLGIDKNVIDGLKKGQFNISNYRNLYSSVPHTQW